ncbi:MAG: DUF975 family protein, partial [Clostridia bacterium]|nr:DUF975 family protein [Clostridia bacterium]
MMVNYLFVIFDIILLSATYYGGAEVGNATVLITSHSNLLMTTLLILIVIVELGLILAAIILFTLPLTAGLMHYFNRAAGLRGSFGDIFYAFREGRYVKVTGAMAWRMLFTWLWTLLFYVPGIVKGIAYSMVPFILSDNPGIGARRALRLSVEMTQGHKWRIFVLMLSFLGWILLSMCTFNIGLLFLCPYLYATYAELYATLRAQALQKGITSVEELCLLSR